MNAALNRKTITAKSDGWRPQIDAHEASLKSAVEICATFVAAMEAGGPGHWLTLTGVCGCGKTELAKQVFAEGRKHNTKGNAAVYERNKMDEKDRRPECVFLTADRFAERLRAGEYDLPDYLSRDFLVVIDDIGATRDTTSFIADGLYRLCNLRLGKWTVFTTNFSLAEVSAKIDERVASRLIRDNNVLHKITAPDYAIVLRQRAKI